MNVKDWRRYNLLIAIAISCSTVLIGQEQLLSFESKEFVGSDGVTYSGDWGVMDLPEVYGQSHGPRIHLPFLRLRTIQSNPKAPIFLLSGGPGDSPSILEDVARILPVISVLAAKSDVVILEQRGNGLAEPNLSCRGHIKLPLDTPLTHEIFSEAYRKYIVECAGEFEGRMLKGYHVNMMVEDLEQVRQALGYGRIMLFGGSFGSHHALNYIEAYPENVDRALLDCPEGLEHTAKLPSVADEMLVKLSRLVSEDSVLSLHIPSFIDLVNSMLRNLEDTPVSVTIEAPGETRATTIIVGKYDLQLITGLELGRMGYRELPYRYLEMRSGNFDWLAGYALQIRRFERRNLMAVLTDCASGATLQRWKRIEEESSGAILGDALNNINFEACDDLEIDVIRPEAKVKAESDVPILIISGDHDARTPPQNAHDIMKHHAQAKMLSVKYGSHDLFREAFDELLPILQSFLMVDDVSSFNFPREIESESGLRRN